MSLLITALTVAALAFGGIRPLATSLVNSDIPRETGLQLAALWPSGSLGANLSEEVLYRSCYLMPVMGLAGLLLGSKRPIACLVVFWIANLMQALLFDYGHVEQGVVASDGMLIATLAAPQTWVGLLLGWIYRRWGVETAILTHAQVDLFAPSLIVAWAYFAL